MPTLHLTITKQRSGEPTYYAQWRRRRPDGTTAQLKRRVGLAWVDRVDGEWVKRRGRVGAGYLPESVAHAEAQRIMAEVERGLDADESGETLTFADVAAAFIVQRETVKGLRPATMRDYRSVLAQPLVVDFASSRVDAITARDVEALLSAVSATGATARTVNKYRSILAAVFAYGMRPSTFGLPANPAKAADRRREPPPSDLDYYSTEEVELVARTLTAGLWRREIHQRPVSRDERDQWKLDDARDGQAIRIAAYSGLRRSELVALRWRDVDFGSRQIHVRTTISDGREVDAPKSGRRRAVPMSDNALTALDALSKRGEFVEPGDYVIASSLGRRLDADELARRFQRARKKAGLRPLTWHGLRHTFASQAVRGGVDLVTVQAAMGHSKLDTTARYLHARPAHEAADAFSRAQQPVQPVESGQADRVNDRPANTEEKGLPSAPRT